MKRAIPSSLMGAIAVAAFPVSAFLAGCGEADTTAERVQKTDHEFQEFVRDAGFGEENRRELAEQEAWQRQQQQQGNP